MRRIAIIILRLPEPFAAIGQACDRRLLSHGAHRTCRIVQQCVAKYCAPKCPPGVHQSVHRPDAEFEHRRRESVVRYLPHRGNFNEHLRLWVSSSDTPTGRRIPDIQKWGMKLHDRMRQTTSGAPNLRSARQSTHPSSGALKQSTSASFEESKLPPHAPLCILRLQEVMRLTGLRKAKLYAMQSEGSSR